MIKNTGKYLTAKEYLLWKIKEWSLKPLNFWPKELKNQRVEQNFKVLGLEKMEMSWNLYSVEELK